MSKLQLCSIPAPDGSYCQTCLKSSIVNITRDDFGVGNWGWCNIQFPVDYCYAYDWVMNCILCHDGYYLIPRVTDVNICAAKSLGCQTYDSVGKKCITCQAGWTMNTTVNRLSNSTEFYCYFVADKNCLKYDSNNNCLTCATNYNIMSNKCVFWITNCDTMNGNVCQKCKTNYQLDANGNCIAIPQISNCAAQIDFTCQSCMTGYSLNNNQCIYVISNCAIVNGMVCSKCKTGYSVTTDGKCDLIPKIPNCATQIDFTCQSCVNGYSLANN